jgi:hypothetical protein
VQPKPLNIGHKSVFEKYERAYHTEVSDFSFASLFMWRHAFRPSLQELEGTLCVFTLRKDMFFALPPLGPEEALTRVIPAMADYFHSIGRPFYMKAVPERLVDPIVKALGTKVEIKSDPGTWDYVYRTSDLVDLPGRKYQGKRNHLNQFTQKNVFSYEPLSPAIIEECLELDSRWRAKHPDSGSELMAEEEKAIREALFHCEELKLLGGAIRVDGKIRAFAAGALINPETAVVHIEKADVDYPGMFAVINQQFAEHVPAEVELINREEDLGLPGLRRAKRSYHPIFMVKKHELIEI